jgi:hypothetical protein
MARIGVMRRTYGSGPPRPYARPLAECIPDLNSSIRPSQSTNSGEPVEPRATHVQWQPTQSGPRFASLPLPRAPSMGTLSQSS